MRETYTAIIQYSADRVGTSYHKAHTVIKEVSRSLKEHIKLGDAIHCEGLFYVTFQTSKGRMYKNRVFDLEAQIKEAQERLPKIPKHTIHDLVTTYYTRLHRLVSQGKQVNVKGVGYVIPKETEDGQIYCHTRVSPALEKPEMVDFLLLNQAGEVTLTHLEKVDIRFQMVADENLHIPCIVAKERTYQFETIEI